MTQYTKRDLLAPNLWKTGPIGDLHRNTMHAYARMIPISETNSMHTISLASDSDMVRQHACDEYLAAARRRGDRTVSINVGTVHRSLALNNRVPLVCAALGSRKFLTENHLRLISKTGPPSGQSTTVTFTYEILDHSGEKSTSDDPWLALRGIAKDIFASLGGGEAYIRRERANFYGPGKDPSRNLGRKPTKE